MPYSGIFKKDGILYSSHEELALFILRLLKKDFYIFFFYLINTFNCNFFVGNKSFY